MCLLQEKLSHFKIEGVSALKEEETPQQARGSCCSPKDSFSESKKEKHKDLVPDVLCSQIQGFQQKEEAQAKNYYHVITGIQPGAKRGRICVYVDGAPALELTKSASEKLQTELSVGRRLSSAQLEQIRQQARLYETQEYALRLLGRRAFSEAELRRRLLRRGHPEEAVEQTVRWLAELGYLNDEQYALSRWETLRQRRLGAAGIVQILRREGVSAELAREICAAQSDETQEHALAQELAARRNALLRHLPWPQRRQRLYAYLARRGFDYEVIAEALETLALAEDEESSSEVNEEA